MPNPQPSLKTRDVYHADLRDAGDFTKNFVLDYKPVTVLSFPSLTDGTPANLQSMGTGTPVVTNINTSGIASLVMVTTDTHEFRVELPYDMDVREECGFCVKWQKTQAGAGATGTCLFTLTYDQKQIGVSTTGAGLAATPLSLPLAIQADLAQYISQWTNIGTIAAGSLNALTAGRDCLDFSLLCTLGVVTDIGVDCVQMWYKPRLI